jgi:dihydroxy-acid dehydratase
LGKTVKKSVVEKGMIGWQYNTIGVSDAITMGSEGESHCDRPQS